MSARARKIVIDTDPGVGIPGTDADDGIALLLALADPRLELLAVTTTFGNCPPELSARGAAAILEAAGRRDIPIGIGAPTALSGSLDPLLIEAYRGDRGRMGRIPLPEAPAGPRREASDLLIETVRRNPGEVTIVAIGPQTNLALALLREPALKDEIHSIVFMGGGLGIQPEFGRGNVTAVAECNMYFDPLAADIVFSSGVPLTMVGLDVTNPATGTMLSEEVIRGLERRSPAAALLAEICTTYLDAPMFEWGHGCVLYDPLAVLAAADSEVGRFERMRLQVETKGEHTRGQTVPVAEGGADVAVMVDVDGHAAVSKMLRILRTL